MPNPITGNTTNGFGAEDYQNFLDWDFAIMGVTFSTNVAPITGLYDIDGDGMPDWWEDMFLGGNGDPEIEIPAHEFHYSRLENLPADPIYAFEVVRGTGIDGAHDGIIYKNMLANYTHLRDVQGYPWTRKFLAHVRRVTRPDLQ